MGSNSELPRLPWLLRPKPDEDVPLPLLRLPCSPNGPPRLRSQLTVLPRNREDGRFDVGTAAST